MRDPVYDAVMGLHVLFAVIGFGALGATGTYARQVRRSTDPFSSPTLLRFFRPGHNVAARAIFLVPLLGATLLALGHGNDVGAAWPWIGLGLWVLAVGVASGVIWPGERQLQQLLQVGPDLVGRLGAVAWRVEVAGALCSALFLAALVVMVAQPG